jgi:hypothetical protein
VLLRLLESEHHELAFDGRDRQAAVALLARGLVIATGPQLFGEGFRLTAIGFRVARNLARTGRIDGKGHPRS